MSETLMTEQAANPNEGQDALTAAEAVATEQAATEQAAPAQPSDSQAGEAKAQAPENYEFSLPEGVQMDEAGIKAFGEFAKSRNMTQEDAQEMLNAMAPSAAKLAEERINAIREQWATDARADKEIGGDKLNENLAVAKKAIDQFGTPELSKLLNESGLGNHPEIIRAFYRAGKAISEDRIVMGANSQGAESDPAKRLFPNQM